MTVLIGVDPHKGSHTAVAIDRDEVVVDELRVTATVGQVDELVGWAKGFETRTWAVESAGGLGYLLSQQLVAAGETVLDVPATLAARVRVLGTGRSDKNDPNDARSVAIAALRAPALAAVRAEDHTIVLRLLAKRHRDLGRARNRTACRLHAVMAELVAGGIDKELVTSQVRALLEGLDATSAAQRTRLELADELVEDLARLDTQMKMSKRRITVAVDASGSTLTDIFGIGPVLAATLLGYTGDPTRFANADAYANYNGTAPIDRSSGDHRIHRLSRRGNRQLNHALHMAAVTQIRFAHSPGRGYYDSKIEAGKTGKTALRALKRRLSDVVYRQLIADTRRHS
ncbi:MAG TPA: IS110 family transposase [Mycobacterium sp.]|nr:IS110 family transposase [Mycobacterium sp.]HUO39485.1 IS110 family transposase [Mycobacterium sp.]